MCESLLDQCEFSSEDDKVKILKADELLRKKFDLQCEYDEVLGPIVAMSPLSIRLPGDSENDLRVSAGELEQCVADGLSKKWDGCVRLATRVSHTGDPTSTAP